MWCGVVLCFCSSRGENGHQQRESVWVLPALCLLLSKSKSPEMVHTACIFCELIGTRSERNCYGCHYVIAKWPPVGESVDGWLDEPLREHVSCGLTIVCVLCSFACEAVSQGRHCCRMHFDVPSTSSVAYLVPFVSLLPVHVCAHARTCVCVGVHACVYVYMCALSQTVSEIPLVFVLPTMYLAITYPLTNLGGASQFFQIWCFLMLGVLVAQVRSCKGDKLPTIFYVSKAK